MQVDSIRASSQDLVHLLSRVDGQGIMLHLPANLMVHGLPLEPGLLDVRRIDAVRFSSVNSRHPIFAPRRSLLWFQPMIDLAACLKGGLQTQAATGLRLCRTVVDEAFNLVLEK